MEWGTIGTLVAVVLTVMVYTYLIGDNILFRLAEHILVGVSVGWATLQIFYNLILPAFANILDGARNGLVGRLLAFLIPSVLGVLLLARPLRASRPITNLIMALVIGTVAALSLAGALSGTLLPQIGSSLLPLNDGDVIGRVVLLIGTLASLWYFHFSVFKPANPDRAVQARNPALAVVSDRLRLLGRWSIMLAFGAIFAAVFLTYVAALIDRLLFLVNFRV